MNWNLSTRTLACLLLAFGLLLASGCAAGNGWFGGSPFASSRSCGST